MILELCLNVLRWMRRRRCVGFFFILMILLASTVAVFQLLLKRGPPLTLAGIHYALLTSAPSSLPQTSKAFTEASRLSYSQSSLHIDAVSLSSITNRSTISLQSFKFEFQLPTVHAAYCSRNFISYGREFAQLHGVVIDRRKCFCDRRGGEIIKSVINQAESVEYYRMSAGCFRLDGCSQSQKSGQLDSVLLSSFQFNGYENNLNTWMRGLRVNNESPVTSTGISKRSEFTIAVQRYEYVNLYHTMTDWYNAYLISRVYFGHANPADTVNILFVDAHPAGSLDTVWNRLFHSSMRFSDLSPTETYFDDLVWGWQGYRSPLFVRSPSTAAPPLLEEFRDYFLSVYEVQSQVHPPVCGGSGRRPSVLFIWRHDYVAHPRNPLGKIMRKITNEAELVQSLSQQFPFLEVSGEQIDSYSMDKQLKMIANTDILIGMHGAGLTHIIFLPSHASVIELTTSSYSGADHFAALSQWRHLHYQRFVIDLNGGASPSSNVIAPSVVQTLVIRALERMCPQAKPGKLAVPVGR